MGLSTLANFSENFGDDMGSSNEDNLKDLLRCMMQYAIEEDNQPGPDKPDKCRICESEWMFCGSGEQVHKTWCSVVSAHKALNDGKLPDHIKLR